MGELAKETYARYLMIQVFTMDEEADEDEVIDRVPLGMLVESRFASMESVEAQLLIEFPRQFPQYKDNPIAIESMRDWEDKTAYAGLVRDELNQIFKEQEALDEEEAYEENARRSRTLKGI